MIGKDLLPMDAAYTDVEKPGGLIPHGGAGAGFASAVRLSQTCVTRRMNATAALDVRPDAHR
jgi:hypothetical protein